MPGRRVESHIASFYASVGRESAAVGFKLMTTQAAAHPRLLPYLRDLGAARFFLQRRDVFATALSWYRAKVSGVYHSDRLHRQQGELELAADEGEFERVLADCRSDRERLLQLHAEFGGRLLEYEDMVSDWDAFIGDIGRDVGLPGLRLRKSLERLASRGTVLRITNEDQLRRRFGDVSAS